MPVITVTHVSGLKCYLCFRFVPYPRPVQLFVRGLPQVGDYLRAVATLPGNDDAVLCYDWWLGKTADGPMTPLGEGDILALTPTMSGRFVRCQVHHGQMSLLGKPWLIGPEGSIQLASGESVNAGILRARGILDNDNGAECITRFELEQMVIDARFECTGPQGLTTTEYEHQLTKMLKLIRSIDEANES